ncbi:MAG: PBP1A family penicillin-binding protein [Clostridia bacterium]|nr:PBP1A family penicillin-binding protein [Clostridia bacterium]
MCEQKAIRIYKSLYRRRRRRRFLRILLLLVLIPLLTGAIWLFSQDAWNALDLEKIYHTDETLLITDRDGTIVSRLYLEENRVSIDVRSLPAHVRNAFLAAEDARFYSHPGFDLVRIAGAALHDLRAGSYVEGASTVTQQLIKLTHLSSEKTLNRKVDEAILSYRLEQLLTKDEILTCYLNRVYFGGGYYGIEAAAEGYFGVHASELTLAQSALLAGVLKSPATYAPHLRPEASVGRRGVVLDLMVEYHMIDAETAAKAKAEPLILISDDVKQKHDSYVDLAITEACRILGCNLKTLLTGGYTIETAMEPDAQRIAETAFSADAFFPTYGDESSEGALVLIDAKTGGVSAIVGGRDDGTALGFNRATRIKRQPGSAIKPILVYAPALEAGYTAASMLLDDATDFGDYTPRNANGRYAGWITMREAVTKSLNLPAVSLFRDLGVSYCKAFAARFGIPFDVRDDSLTLALGGFTYGVSPYRLCGAYAALASGGIYREPYVITRITDRAGTVLYRHTPEETRVMSAGNAFVLTSLLRSVATQGTASRLSELSLPLAAKTGTVGDETGNRDVWLACYNPDYAAVVWMGFDDATGGRCLPGDSGGGTYPAILLSYVFSALYEGRVAPDFPVPDSVISVPLDATTLKNEHVAVLAGSLTPADQIVNEYFVRGTQPVTVSEYWQLPEPPTDLMVALSDDVAEITFTPPSRYMTYRLYREDADGFSILLSTIEGAAYPVTFSDPVDRLNGVFAYYVVPAHPSLQVDGAQLCGKSSEKRWISVYHPISLSP